MNTALWLLDISRVSDDAAGLLKYLVQLGESLNQPFHLVVFACVAGRLRPTYCGATSLVNPFRFHPSLHFVPSEALYGIVCCRER